jgi:NAD(P)-dependent dehydrogenase (short-subunit alcohol dehydrogenase family)
MFGFNRSIPKFCDLKGKVAVITGAGQGMGRTHALVLSRAGAKVVISDVSVDKCQLVADEVKKQRGESLVVRCDVSKKSDIDNLVSETIKKFGKIDILVNNAGIFPFQSFLEMQEKDFEKVIDINLKGYFLMAQACAKEMVKQKSGAIVNITSIAMGQVGVGFAGLTHYCASKGGITAMSEAMALELAPFGIRVNCVAPGAIDTPGASSTSMDDKAREAMLAPIPMHRQGKPEEISNAVLFLASQESSYMTGATIVVDGGWVAG